MDEAVANSGKVIYEKRVTDGVKVSFVIPIVSEGVDKMSIIPNNSYKMLSIADAVFEVNLDLTKGTGTVKMLKNRYGARGNDTP